MSKEELIEFAQKIYEEGYDNSWESHQESVYLNLSYTENLFH